ncbi:MAG: hypothetical protein M9962_07665 [Oligoflexia bacterium]|nr:hypothetical protein [Oligoflexia bacterium]
MRVTVKVKLHSYDSNLTNSTGIAPSETRTYEYLLPVEDNSIQGEGTWISTNPDFIWVPIATKDCNNGRENPHIKDSLVKQIMALPRE